MLVPDVNVLVNAETEGSAHYPAARGWFDSRANGDEALAVPEMVLLGFARVTTGLPIERGGISVERAFAVCEAIRTMPAFRPMTEGPRHWSVFQAMVTRSGIVGRHLTDAYLAAFALENEATFVTFDRGFRRFRGLKVLVPGEA